MGHNCQNTNVKLRKFDENIINDRVINHHEAAVSIVVASTRRAGGSMREAMYNPMARVMTMSSWKPRRAPTAPPCLYSNTDSSRSASTDLSMYAPSRTAAISAVSTSDLVARLVWNPTRHWGDAPSLSNTSRWYRFGYLSASDASSDSPVSPCAPDDSRVLDSITSSASP